jgi:predicted RNA binding protein YcfA (HicA-like mRNA interferase family)
MPHKGQRGIRDKGIELNQKRYIIKFMDGKKVIRTLEKKGWKVLRIQGSHYRLGKDGKRTTVPVHGIKDLGKGLLAAIERQTGVKLS